MNIDFVNILGVIAFVVALLISVMIHEFGHFITARKFGMRVSEFFVGFGKRIWSITRGETEYGIKAIPAGGYCRIEGMTPTDAMPDAQEDRAFWRASSGKKLIVLGAGSFAHFLIGFILLFTVFAGTGYTDYPPAINKVEAASPAAAAGFLAGDRVISINGEKLESWDNGVNTIANSQGKPLTFAIERGGEKLSITATGQYIAEEKRYRLGIYPGYDREFKRDSIGRALDKSVSNMGILVKASFTSLMDLPEKVPQLFRQTFLGEERDPEGLVGVVGAARVSGDVVSLDRANANERLTTFIFLVASLNVFVGIFNLLPILPLDGGHMAVAIADEIRALFARIRRRPRPAPINVNVLTPVTAVVVVALGFLTILLVLADIINPISLN
jgi:membrane-associated protease RseP (regulator of RpoE activity)